MTVIRIEMWNRDDAWNIGTKVTLTSDGVRAERAGPGGQGFFGRPGSRNIRRREPDKAKIYCHRPTSRHARDTPTGAEGQAKTHPAVASGN